MILVFKTNVRRKKDEKKIERLLNTIPVITRWNIDRDDVDRVLRIESINVSPGKVINALSEAGYHCEELTS